MIDWETEDLISLTEAAALLPRRRRGRKPDISTMYRWTTVGCKGVMLECIQVGGARCTSKQALTRFFGRLSAGPIRDKAQFRSDPTRGCRTLAQRQRASAKAGRELAEGGA
jgi:hypothetical protein